ncbi:MAG: hypothetical protein JWP52_3895 [Rhizobacter sp.]|nr:hypothetical protein [Rhizobacter sp.]
MGMPGIAASANDDDEHVPQLDFTQAPKDTLVWGTLAKTGVRRIDGKFVRTFTAPVLELDGKTVTLYGYATPVDDHADPHRLFLLSSQRIACRGCAAPVEPEGIVEVTLKRPVALRTLLKASDALAVRGKLVLVKDDAKGLLYQLVDGAVVDKAGRPKTRQRSGAEP